jgi:hypothetical protein
VRITGYRRSGKENPEVLGREKALGSEEADEPKDYLTLFCARSPRALLGRLGKQSTIHREDVVNVGGVVSFPRLFAYLAAIH